MSPFFQSRDDLTFVTRVALTRMNRNIKATRQEMWRPIDTATHCSTLQRTATHCNALQHGATRYNTLQHAATSCNTLQRLWGGGDMETNGQYPAATHCNTLQHSTLQHTASHFTTLHHAATHYNTLQHAATPCNTCGKEEMWRQLDNAIVYTIHVIY